MLNYFSHEAAGKTCCCSSSGSRKERPAAGCWHCSLGLVPGGRQADVQGPQAVQAMVVRMPSRKGIPAWQWQEEALLPEAWLPRWASRETWSNTVEMIPQVEGLEAEEEKEEALFPPSLFPPSLYSVPAGIAWREVRTASLFLTVKQHCPEVNHSFSLPNSLLEAEPCLPLPTHYQALQMTLTRNTPVFCF